MRGVAREIRHAVRWLWANPGFAVTAIGILALGIGATTAMFSVANAALLRPLPFPDGDRLAVLYGVKPQEGDDLLPLSQPDVEDFRAASRSFGHVAVWAIGRSTITGGERAEIVQHAVVSAELFPLLGVTPAYGRSFRDEENARGQAPVAVVSASFSERRFGHDGGALGQALTLDGVPVTVVGILPPGFRFLSFPNDTEVWLPLGQDSFAARRYAREVRSLGAIGRLRDGVDMSTAAHEAERIAATLRTAHPDANRGRSLRVIPLREQATEQARSGIVVLFGAVAAVLLIGCANIANLLLARGTGRRRELAIRGAVGASRWRLARQLVVEALVLSTIGGVVGVAVAVWVLDLLALVPLATPSFFTPYTLAPTDVVVDVRVLLFAIAATAGAALLSGTLPAVQASGVDLLADLRDGPGDGRLAGRRLREALVVLETAAALVLLVGAALLLQSYLRLQSVEIGFTPEQATAFDLQISPMRAARSNGGAGIVERLSDALSRLPGTRAVGASQYLPFSGVDAATGIIVDGAPPEPHGTERRAHYRSVTPGYFDAMEIRVVAGRGFAASDAAGASRVAIVNETMARRFWPEGLPIGKRVALNLESLRFRRDGPPTIDPSLGMREIVGVVADTRHGGFDTAPVPEMFVPLAQRPVPHLTMVVRSTLAATAEPTLREAVAAVDADQPIANVRALSTLVDASLARPRFNTTLLAAFAALALLLAVLGLYGVLAYAVSMRSRELGIRMALGMSARDGGRLVVIEGLRLVLTGVAVGLLSALALARVLSTVLYDISPTDAPTLVVVALALIVTSVVASWLPARRAMSVDPAAALRQN